MTYAWHELSRGPTAWVGGLSPNTRLPKPTWQNASAALLQRTGARQPTTHGYMVMKDEEHMHGLTAM